MKLHSNAKITPKGRLLICQRLLENDWSLAKAAKAAGVSDRTAAKWVARYKAEGKEGLLDRSSAPRHIPHKTPQDRIEAVTCLRKIRMTAAEIAEVLTMALSTVSAIIGRIGLGKLSRLEPKEPANRYERRNPGELLHIDVKKLGRIVRPGKRIAGMSKRSRKAGWEYVHVCIDDASRVGYVEVLGNEQATTATSFLTRAIAYYASLGVKVEGVMTDNGPAYCSSLHASACRSLGLKHLRTRPYRPRTNGKAERFIRTLVDGWAYGAVFRNSEERTQALPGWLDYYNRQRPHSSLGRLTPVSRLETLMNNVPGSYS